LSDTIVMPVIVDIRKQGKKFFSLGRDSDRSWCRHHTTVWLQPMDPWMWVAAHSYAAADAHEAMDCDHVWRW